MKPLCCPKCIWEEGTRYVGCHHPTCQCHAVVRVKMRNIGMLRQWLNEDRIGDARKMVTNEDLLAWLSLK